MNLRYIAGGLCAFTLLLPMGQTLADLPSKPAKSQRGVTTMNTDQSALEHFNNLENFLADTAPFDFELFRKYQNGNPNMDDVQVTREDGTEVRMLMNDKIDQWGLKYHTRLTFKNSPFKYSNSYDERGVLKYKSTDFYGLSYDGLYEYIDGQRVRTDYKVAMNPVVPLNKARANILKESGIDIFNVKQVYLYGVPPDAQHYHVKATQKPGGSVVQEYMIDPETGKVLYSRTTFEGDDGGSTNPGIRVNESEAAYSKVYAILKNHIKDENPPHIYMLFRKVNGVNISNTTRFYEAFISLPSDVPERMPLASYLVDIKTGKILDSFAFRLGEYPIGGVPYVRFDYEYGQFLKIKEVEEKELEEKRAERKKTRGW